MRRSARLGQPAAAGAHAASDGCSASPSVWSAPAEKLSASVRQVSLKDGREEAEPLEQRHQVNEVLIPPFSGYLTSVFLTHVLAVAVCTPGTWQRHGARAG